MTTSQLKEVLAWYMCSDPWPGGDQQTIVEWLNFQCRKAGYVDWVDAYHKL